MHAGVATQCPLPATNPVFQVERPKRCAGAALALHPTRKMTTSQYARAAALVALLALAAGCADITPPASPPTPATPPPGVPVASGGGFQALSRPGEIYKEVGAPYGAPTSL